MKYIIFLFLIAPGVLSAQEQVRRLSVSCDGGKPVPVSVLATKAEIEAAKTSPKAAFDLWMKSPCQGRTWIDLNANRVGVTIQPASSSKASSSVVSSSSVSSQASSQSSSLPSLVTLTWGVPQQRMSGLALSPELISHYEVSRGSRVETVQPMPNPVTYITTPAANGEIFTVAVVLKDGSRSEFVPFEIIK